MMNELREQKGREKSSSRGSPPPFTPCHHLRVDLLTHQRHPGTIDASYTPPNKTMRIDIPIESSSEHLSTER